METKNKITKRIRIIQDRFYDWEANDLIKIAYLKTSRYVLGDNPCTPDQLHEIGECIAKGTMIGLEVYAHIHGGVALSTSQFSCPWDSGACGFVYMDKEDVVGWALRPDGRRGTYCTAADKAKALEACENHVKVFNDYLNGNVYGFVKEELFVYTHVESGRFREVWENAEEKDSCWGFLGDIKDSGILDEVKDYLNNGYVLTNEEGDPIEITPTTKENK